MYFNKNADKFSKKILTATMAIAIPIMIDTTPVNAEINEEELLKITDKHEMKDVVIEEGIVLKKGETRPSYSGWELSNNNIVKIDKNGTLSTLNEGTVFLTKEIGEKVHIIEIYVDSSSETSNHSSRSIKVDRNYYKVFVDPGHGGKDNGASRFGRNEDDINLQVAHRVVKKLREKGIDVEMSRTSDIYVGLSERGKMANQYGADVFISIHHNSSESGSTILNGVETYYNTNKSSHKGYATEIQSSTIKETSAKNRGVKTANHAVTRVANMPGVLVEGGYINNKIESAKLVDPEYQEKLALGIANGVENYLKANIELNGNPKEQQIDNLEEPSIPEVPQSTKIGTVKASSLNVRSGYGTSYFKIGSLSKGSKVEIVESKDGWHKIKYKSRYGYISASYVR